MKEKTFEIKVKDLANGQIELDVETIRDLIIDVLNEAEIELISIMEIK